MASVSYKLLDQIPINRTDIDQSLLDIEYKERSNPLTWSGQFSPQLVESLLSKYVSSSDKVLDPFVGSGTILFEAANRKLAACGSDINPAACYLARVYSLANRSRAARETACCDLEAILNLHFPAKPPALRPVAKLKFHEKLDLIERLRKTPIDSDGSIMLAAILVLSDFFSERSDEDALFDAWRRVQKITLRLEESDPAIRVVNADARALPFPDLHFDAVITSPPYINVFNYHQHFRPTVESLGWKPLSVAKAEIGSNRKNRSNRFLTVIQYCLEMAQVFSELGRVCKRGSRVIFVVGRESRVRGIPFYNGRLIASVGETSGFRLTMRQERVFVNRYGQSICEDILHFDSGATGLPDAVLGARQIASDSLAEAITAAEGEVRANIRDAIEVASQVTPSPFYERNAAFVRRA